MYIFIVDGHLNLLPTKAVANRTLAWNYRLHHLFVTLSLSLHCLSTATSNQRALSFQKGHSVPLMVFWFIPSSFLPSHPSLSPPFSHREAGESLPPGCQEGARPISCRVTSRGETEEEKQSDLTGTWKIVFPKEWLHTPLVCLYIGLVVHDDISFPAEYCMQYMMYNHSDKFLHFALSPFDCLQK